VTLKDVDFSIGITVSTFSKASKGEAALTGVRRLRVASYLSNCTFEHKYLSLRKRETCADNIAFFFLSN